MNKLLVLASILSSHLLLSACGVGSAAGDISVSDVVVSGQNNGNGNYTILSGEPATITISWTPPTEYTNNKSMPDLAGYKIYFGTEPDQLEYLMDVPPNLTTQVIENDPRIIQGLDYYFAMTAYSSNKLESPRSDVVYYKGSQ